MVDGMKTSEQNYPPYYKPVVVFVCIMIVLIFLAITKPSEDDFYTWLDATATSPNRGTLGEVGFTLSWIQTAGISRYKDYAIFAIVDSRFDTFGVFNPTGNYRRRFIGVGGQWISLDGPKNRYQEREYINR